MTDDICAVETCESPVVTRGWCLRHYRRWRKHGDPLGGRRSHLDPLPKCAIVACAMPTKRIIRGLCENHYWRSRNRSDLGPSDLLRINGQNERRFWAKVDRVGAVNGYRPELGPCWIWQGHPDGKGYGQIRIDGVLTMAHRFSYELLVGPIPIDLTIDHLCMVELCVRPTHLEPVTNAENARRAAEARAERGLQV